MFNFPNTESGIGIKIVEGYISVEYSFYNLIFNCCSDNNYTGKFEVHEFYIKIDI